MTSKRPDLRLLPDPELPLLGGADDWIYNAAAAPGAGDWEPMADGYHQAAEIVAEHLAERPGFRGYLTSPLLFLCRHSLELRIKGIIANSADLLDTPVDLIHDHDLRALWRRARPILDEVFPKTEEAAQDAGLVDRFVQELGDIDPRSMRFRYPDGAGAPEGSIVNLRRFWDRYLRAAELLGGAGFGILNIERGPEEP